MDLIQIQEPDSDIVVGIDFGTTNSLVSFSKDKSPFIIPNTAKQKLIPSIINLDNQVISSVKRLFGKSYKEIISSNIMPDNLNIIDDNDIAKVRINNKNFSPIELGSIILSDLKNQAENYFDKKISKAVITIPAYFNEQARVALKKAANISGLEVIRLLNEPTAAGYAYKLHQNSLGKYLIYDLGGGTFDVSVVKMQKGILQVLATTGDSALGGDDIDKIIASYLACDFSKAREYKEKLSFASFIKEVGLSQQKLNELIAPIVDKTIQITQEVFTKDIKGIILAGGSTKFPLIKDMLTKTFNVEVLDNIDQSYIVALGAALQAENLMCKNNDLIIDVTPLSLGIEVAGDEVDEIIHNNSPIPISESREFTTSLDNQSSMKFNILQGKGDFLINYKSLAIFELNNLPEAKANELKIEVIFTIDADGILIVNVIGKNFDIFKELIINTTYDLTETEIQNFILNSKDNFKSYEKKYILHKIQRAKMLLQNLGDNIQQNEKELLQSGISKLKNNINTVSLSEVTLLINKILNIKASLNLKQKLKGKNIYEFY